MAEVYPSDSDLLNITEDSETGVEYIPTGQAPYYLSFRKMLYRLLLTATRGSDLRVYSEGGLDIGVKAGKFFNGANLVSYAGSAGNTLADNKANIYLYLDSSGSLVTTEYSAWPDMAASPHVRLAVITTSGGEVTSISDARGHHVFCMPNKGEGIRKKIESHTGDDTLTVAESGGVHTNLGAGDTITLTLPASPGEGVAFDFAVQANQQLRIDPGTNAIRDSSGQTNGKYKSASAVGACLSIVSDTNNDWAVIGKSGTWTEQA